MVENEVRFALTSALSERLNRHYLRNVDVRREQNKAVYFDSEDHLLWRSGVEFRVRQNAKGAKQTVKCQIGGGGLFARSEAEIDLPSGEPDFEHLCASIPSELVGKITKDLLRPVFQTDVERVKASIVYNASTIELAYDRGAILAGGRSLPMHEVELELKDGQQTDLAAAALAFLRKVPAGLLIQGKASRGYGLATGAAPQPVFADRDDVPPETSMPDAIAILLRTAFAHALANQPAVIATDAPEAVHQMRVGLRRARSIISAFQPVLDLSGAAKILGETKDFFALLGDVRDADVFLTETIQKFPAETFSNERRAMLVEAVTFFQQTARQRAIDFAAGPAFARLVLTWLEWIESRGWLRNEQPIDRLLLVRPVKDYAAGRRAEMHKKLVKRGHRALTGTIDDWHDARIAAKKLRYAGGPLLAVMEADANTATVGDSARFAKRLSQLQDALGEFNDLCNVGPFLLRVSATVPARSRRNFEAAAAFCDGWCQAKVLDAVSSLEKTWTAFEAASKEPS